MPPWWSHVSALAWCGRAPSYVLRFSVVLPESPRAYRERVTETLFWLVVLLFLAIVAAAGILQALDPLPAPAVPHSHAQSSPTPQTPQPQPLYSR